VVNPHNCCEQLVASYARLDEANLAFEDGRELNDKEKDMRKCMLVVATTLSELLADKPARRGMINTLPKPLLIALTKSDWLVLEREEDWYKFCVAWAKHRVRKTLGIPEPVWTKRVSVVEIKGTSLLALMRYPTKFTFPISRKEER